MIFMGVFAPLLAPYPYEEIHLEDKLQPPCKKYWLGTDQFGRDILSRIIYGARVSLLVGLGGTLLGLGVGVLLGSVAAYYGKAVEEAIMRFIDIIMSFPYIIIAVALVSILGPGLFKLIMIVGFLAVPRVARITRAPILALKEVSFVEAARAIGRGDRQVLIKHILPNCLMVILVYASLSAAQAIRIEAALSFLGLGIQPPTPSWGLMLSSGRQYIIYATWLTTFPGIAISLTILGLNLVSDGLRDMLDPRLRRAAK
jgi:ABC-type dipeptide/oligopeptide/nickel transport system permease subunit